MAESVNLSHEIERFSTMCLDHDEKLSRSAFATNDSKNTPSTATPIHQSSIPTINAIPIHGIPPPFIYGERGLG